MIWRSLPLILMVLTACSSEVEQQVSTKDTNDAVSVPIVAVISCRVNGMPIGVSACFIGSVESASGSLKVESGGIVKQYTNYELAGKNGSTLEFRLKEPFDITAQASSESGYVLRMEVRAGSRIIFQDETTEFGLIDADSTLLEI